MRFAAWLALVAAWSLPSASRIYMLMAQERKESAGKKLSDKQVIHIFALLYEREHDQSMQYWSLMNGLRETFSGKLDSEYFKEADGYKLRADAATKAVNEYVTAKCGEHATLLIEENMQCRETIPLNPLKSPMSIKGHLVPANKEHQ